MNLESGKFKGCFLNVNNKEVLKANVTYLSELRIFD